MVSRFLTLYLWFLFFPDLWADLENYPNMRRQLEALGLSVEKLWQTHFAGLSAPHDPLLGTLEKYIERYSSSSTSSTKPMHQQELSTRLLKVLVAGSAFLVKLLLQVENILRILTSKNLHILEGFK